MRFNTKKRKKKNHVSAHTWSKTKKQNKEKKKKKKEKQKSTWSVFKFGIMNSDEVKLNYPRLAPNQAQIWFVYFSLHYSGLAWSQFYLFIYLKSEVLQTQTSHPFVAVAAFRGTSVAFRPMLCHFVIIKTAEHDQAPTTILNVNLGHFLPSQKPRPLRLWSRKKLM